MLALFRGALFCLALLLAANARAATPPVLQGNSDVPYPAGAHGDASVVLELVVEADGTVSQAEVIEGVEPFAEQARNTALGWRFSPALQDDTPVAARVRARVDFQQQVAPETPAEPAAAPTTPVSSAPLTAPVEPPPIDLEVHGERREIGQTRLSAAEVRQMPGAFGDPFRAIEPLPGVTPYVSGIPYFYVRGAPPNDNGYFVDGVRVPLLFHVGVAEGVIHPGLIDRIDFFPGAAPARHGGFAGAIISARTREPAPRFRGEVNLRLIDTGALLEAPFDGESGSALIAGRYGYPGPIVTSITPDLILEYWDYQARVTYGVGDHGRLGLLAFGSHDYFATGEGRDLVEQLVSDFHRLDLRYDQRTSGGNVRLAVTGGLDAQGSAPTYVSDRLLAARLEVEQELSGALRLRGGVEVARDDYGFELKLPPADQSVAPARLDLQSSGYPPPTNTTLAVHLDSVLRVGPRIEVVPGARFGLFRSARAGVTASIPAVDPRLAARILLTRELALLSAFGIAHQYPTLRVGDIPAALVSVPGFPAGSRRLQRVAQASQGLELALPGGVVVGATAFLSYFWGLTDLTAQCFELTPGSAMTDGSEPPPMPWVCPNNAPVNGRAYGLELMVKRSLTERLGGLLSYTLSRSIRQAHFVTASGGDAIATVPSENDRRHVLNAMLGYDLGRRWRAGGRFTFFTGNPYSKTDGTIPLSPYNSERYDSFYRVDLRLEKRWPLGEDGSIAFVLEGQNVTLNKQSAGVDCEGNLRQGPMGLTSTTRCSPAMIGPITVPSVGVEAFF